MSNVILPFLMSMLLGRTIDLRSYTISGINVFDDSDYDETTVGDLTTTYNVIQGNSFPYTFFGVPADIVLRIKSGFLSSFSGAMGLDGILKDTSWKYNSAVVSFTSIYRTVDRTLKPGAPPFKDWESSKMEDGQTHYAKALFYGGWHIVLFRFHCDVTSDVVVVRRLLTEHLGVVGVLGNDTVGSWNRAREAIEKNTDIRGSVKVSAHVYSTVPLEEFISTPESLLKAVKELPSAVGPVGQPMYMSLEPLHVLKDTFPVVKEDVAMLDKLEQLDEMLDDVKLTKSSMMKWMGETLTAFDEDEEEKITAMLERLNDLIRVFNKFVGGISLFGEVNQGHLFEAMTKYLGGLERGIGTYNLALRSLKEEIDAECDDDFHDKVKGLLDVYEDHVRKVGDVAQGLKGCQEQCVRDERCRAVGYADSIDELDLDTGSYFKKERQCWIYYRSTSTAVMKTPNGLAGDVSVYDRMCY